MNRESLLFCSIALGLSVAACALGYRWAALPPDAVHAAAAPAAAETLPDVDLGGGFGTVPVVELLGYYVENPPAPAAAGSAAPAATQRFGGC